MKGVKFLSGVKYSLNKSYRSSHFFSTPLFIIAMFFIGPASASSSCANIDCDCSSLMELEQVDECKQQQSMLTETCQLAGKPSGFCLVGGLDAFPVALSLPAITRQKLISTTLTVSELEAQSKVLHWSVSEDQSAAQALQNNGNYRGALALRKRENSSRKKLHAMQYRLAELLRSADEPARAQKLLLALQPLHEAAAINAYRLGMELWAVLQLEQSQLSDKQQRLQEILAQRLLRNAGDAMELAADAAFQAGRMSLALSSWQLAASYTQELITWKQSVGAKEAHILFYQQRAAARWQRASLLTALAGRKDLVSATDENASTLNKVFN